MFDNNKINLIFGAAVKELRIKACKTQEQLAEELNMQPNSIAKIETGRSFVSSDIIARICNYFNVEPYVLFSKRIEFPVGEKADYIKEIKRLLPGLKKEKLRDIYNIIIAITK